MSYKVIYWKIHEDNTVKKVTSICFSGLPKENENKIKIIRYLCPIAAGIKQEVIDYYLDFVSKTFTGRVYSYRQIKLKKKKYIHFSLDCSNWNKYHILVYLSAIRCLDEAQEIIQELYNSRAEAFDTQFIKFQDIHKEVCDGKITLKKNGLHTLDCHGLIYVSSYSGYTCKKEDYKPISYEIFKDRLEKQSSPTVHEYFKPVLA